jgi:hypothetical protein
MKTRKPCSHPHPEVLWDMGVGIMQTLWCPICGAIGSVIKGKPAKWLRVPKWSKERGT